MFNNLVEIIAQTEISFYGCMFRQIMQVEITFLKHINNLCIKTQDVVQKQAIELLQSLDLISDLS